MLTTGDTYYISTTVIDADQSGQGVYSNGCDSTAVLNGFSIEVVVSYFSAILLEEQY